MVRGFEDLSLDIRHLSDRLQTLEALAGVVDEVEEQSSANKENQSLQVSGFSSVCMGSNSLNLVGARFDYSVTPFTSRICRCVTGIGI